MAILDKAAKEAKKTYKAEDTGKDKQVEQWLKANVPKQKQMTTASMETSASSTMRRLPCSPSGS